LSVLAHQQTTILRNDFARRAGRRSGVPYFPIARQAFEANCRRQVTITTKAVDRKRVGRIGDSVIRRLTFFLPADYAFG
jgi:hypothetical protein